MAINKVVLGERTLIDLSLDTATEADVAKGKYFHRADGEIVEGTLEGSGGGGSGGGGLVESDVNFYDYDGTLLYAYPRAGVMAMTELPEPPTHEGLTFQEWNWTLSEIQSYGGPVNVGATYITDDGKTRFYIRLTDMSQAYFQLYLNFSISGDTAVINWGDGTGDETYEIEAYNTGAYYNSNPRTFAHTYENLGDYVITVDSGEKIALGYTGGRVSLLGVEGNHIAIQALYKIELGKVSGISCNAIAGYGALETITIPRGVTVKNQTGGGYNFMGSCYSLKSIILPRGFTIGNESFSYCVGLKCVVIPGNGKIHNPTRGVAYCYHLRSFTVPKTVTSIYKHFFQNDVHAKIHLHDGITSVGQYAFNECNVLEEVDLPNATSIDANAFQGCYNLRRVVLSDNLKSIPNYAFENCTNLMDINIPSGLTTIGASAFRYCRRIERLNFPASLASISTMAFSNCKLLKCVDFTKHTSVPTLAGYNAFDSTRDDLQIRVPAALYDEWIAATNWSYSTIKSKIVAV